jgi:hypothetical protein
MCISISSQPRQKCCGGDLTALTTPTKAGPKKAQYSNPTGFERSLLYMPCCGNRATTRSPSQHTRFSIHILTAVNRSKLAEVLGRFSNASDVPRIDRSMYSGPALPFLPFLAFTLCNELCRGLFESILFREPGHRPARCSLAGRLS